MGIRAPWPADDVELVIVDRERERFDAHGAPRALEVAVADLQRPPALERIHHLLEHLLVFGERLLASADEEDELAPEILEAVRVQRVAAEVVHEIVHALLVARALEELGEARADAAGDEGGDGDPFLSPGALRPMDADVEATLPPLAHEGNMAADRFQLAIGGGMAHPEKSSRLVPRDLAAGEQGRDQPGGPFDGAEASQVLSRHDPWRIISSATDHKSPERGTRRLHRHSTQGRSNGKDDDPWKPSSWQRGRWCCSCCGWPSPSTRFPSCPRSIAH